MVVNDETHDPALQLDPAWHYTPLPDAPMPLRLRIPLLVLVTLGHLGVFWVFDRSGFVMPTARMERETTLVFLEPPAPEPVPVPEPVPAPEVPPDAEPVPEPLDAPEPEPIKEPVVEAPLPEPVEEPVQEPVEEPAPEPVPEPVPEAEPVAAPPVEAAPEQRSESVPEPEAPLAPEPVALPDPAIVRLPVAAPAPERIVVDAPPAARPSPAEIDVVLPPDVAPPSRAVAPSPAPLQAEVAPLVKRRKPRLDRIAVEQERPEEAAEVAAVVSEGALAPPAAPTVDEEPTPADDFSMPPAGGALQAVEPSPRPGGSLRLYGADGSLDLPDEVREQLGSAEDDGRGFSFQQPGLMAAGSFLRRQPALVYEPTVFDGYWIPEKDVLTALLERAVEATTGTVEVPIPGSPGSRLVCSVSILAAGGACGIRNNNDGQAVGLDDPDTLNPEEAGQCEAWWRRIVDATEESAWRGTRKLYDAQCRKPLERKPPDVPMPAGG